MKAEHLILLRCSKKNFAIKADFVVEVIKIDFLQKVPGSHDNIAGVSVHRGILLPLYFIDQEHAGSDKLFYAIILYKRERYIGFICEEAGIFPLENARIVDDKNIIKNYNRNEIVKMILDIDNEIYGLIEYEKIDTMYYENNKGGMNESEDINSG